MSRSTSLITFFALVALGGVAGSWYARQHRAVPHPPAAAPSTPLTAIGRPLDPAFVAAMKTETGPKRWLRLVAASEQATAAEFPALIALAGDDHAAVRLIAARWAEVDPKHMFKSIHGELLSAKDTSIGAQNSTRTDLIESLLETWGKNDPGALVKALNEVPDFSGRAALREAALYELTKSDPASTFEAMALWNVGHYYEPTKLREWAAKDPAAAARSVQKLNNQNTANEALREIGKVWAGIDPQAALAHAETLTGNARLILAAETIGIWAKRDPQAAAAYAARQDNANLRAALGGMVARSMGESDPDGAIVWSESNLRGQARTEAVAAVIVTAAGKDPGHAAELVAGLEDDALRSSASDGLFRTWFSKTGQRQAAVEWLIAQPDEQMQRNAFSHVELSWYREDPAGAAEFLTGPNGHLASLNLVSNVARDWALKTPDVALAQTARLPEAQAIPARARIATEWLATRPDAAMAYFNQLPPGPERNSVITSVAVSVPSQNLERAATFLRSLPGEEQQLALRRMFTEQRDKVEAAMKKP